MIVTNSRLPNFNLLELHLYSSMLEIFALQEGFQFIELFIILSFMLCPQEPFVNIPEETIREALKVVIGKSSTLHMLLLVLGITLLHLMNFHSLVCPLETDVRNHPVLIHCKRGKVCSPLFMNTLKFKKEAASMPVIPKPSSLWF